MSATPAQEVSGFANERQTDRQTCLCTHKHIAHIYPNILWPLRQVTFEYAPVELAV